MPISDLNTHQGLTPDELFLFKIKPPTVDTNFNAVWQFGLVGQLIAQYGRMNGILRREVPMPGVNVFRPKEVTTRVLQAGFAGFCFGAAFGFTQQMAKSFRGKNDGWNSAFGGWVAGALYASRSANPWAQVPFVLLAGFPAFLIHYSYLELSESQYKHGIKLNNLRKQWGL